MEGSYNLNLQRPINQKMFLCVLIIIPTGILFTLALLMVCGAPGLERALQKFVETCQNTEDEITASMITECSCRNYFRCLTLSQLQIVVWRTSGEIEPDQTPSEDIANQDTESETSVTSTLEPIVAAEKDVEGTPVEDPDAVLEHEKEISSLRDKLEEKDARDFDVA